MEIDLERIKKNKSVKELLEFSIININKPAGPTSFGTDTILKKALKASKTSHFGTLDPMVTGVLPIAINRACRLMGHFIGKKKTYVGIMKIHEDLPFEELKKHAKKFLGEITQLPPRKSSVKRAERQRTIYTFNLLEKEGKNILFETEVQAGTYIRKLIHDLGELIGGAHMAELRRTKASIFEEKDSYTVYEFLEAFEEYEKGDDTKLKAMIIPGEVISKVLPVVQVKKEAVVKLYHGGPLLKRNTLSEIPKNTEKLAVFENERFIGVFSSIDGKEIIGKAEFILQPLKK